MNSWNLQEVAGLLEEAGAVAMSMTGHLKAEFKSDRSVVTDADKAVERLLSAEFDRPEEGVRLIGEETSSGRSADYVDAALAGKTWIVDPIDGTAPFSHDIPLWGVSIGFMDGGVIREGAIFLPPMGEMFGSANGVAYRAAAGMGKSKDWGLAKRLEPWTAPHVEFDDGAILNISQRMARGGLIRLPNPIHSLCSCVYSSAALMTGRHVAYIFSAKIWDMAGSLPALKALGFHAVLHNGENIMDLRVRPEVYDLGEDAKSPWHIKGHAILAKDESSIEKTLASCQFP